MNPPVRPEPCEGYTSAHGALEGLRQRLAAWLDRVGRDKTLPWVGLGLVNDLEVTVQLLNLREFGEYLVAKGPPEQAGFGREILDLEFELASLSDALGGEQPPHMTKAVEELVIAEQERDRIMKAVGEATGDEFDDDEAGTLKAVQTLRDEAHGGNAMRQALVDLGALAPGDTETDVSALLRALLS